jgi:phosphohistidine phosphatase
MDVYLVRHAIAHERNHARWPKDALRPLTPAGKKRFRKAAHGLAQLMPKGTTVVTSPYTRARDTAAILIEVGGLGKAVEAVELASGATVGEIFELLRSRKSGAVVLVGHEPNLSILMSTALAGDRARFAVEFKKGGAACLRFAKAIAPGRATLRWLLPPRVLRKLK